MNFFLAFGVQLGLLIIADGIWLTTMSNWYQQQLSRAITFQVKWLPALLFYPLYALAVTWLVYKPDQTVWEVATKAAVIGAVAYGTYNLTNFATVKNWSEVVTVVDWIWGTSATALTASLTFVIVKALIK